MMSCARQAMLVTLLLGPPAAAQSRHSAVLWIESPGPTLDAAETGSEPDEVSVVVASADVREVLLVVNQVPARIPVRDGRAVAPMRWVAGNNRVTVEARSRGRVERDAVTVFRRPRQVAPFAVSVARLDGGDARGLEATVTRVDGSGDPPGTDHFEVALRWTRSAEYSRTEARERASRGDARGRPARVEPRVRVEVRLASGLEREQRWVFVARPRELGEWREIGTFEVSAALLAP
ncbi:MAG: hypothetical protein Q8S73_28475 [Deltaproteobacteria bacterium]|nr:hypothetical protein [Myxococcales bacterium]MDP3218075.1 hypothetical protein [Deltaproteobacteria bacterium]